jgi:hypothetical protein
MLGYLITLYNLSTFSKYYELTCPQLEISVTVFTSYRGMNQTQISVHWHQWNPRVTRKLWLSNDGIIVNKANS